MLVLRRKKGEVLHIGPDIRIHVVDITHGKVALGIDAPDDVKVLRDELVQYGKDDGHVTDQAEPMARNIQYSTRVMSVQDLGRVLMLMKLTDIEPPPEDILEELFHDTSTIGIVAETVIRNRTRIIGHLFVSLYEDHMVMQDCMVHPKYRLMGIGSTLINYAKQSVADYGSGRLVNHCGEYNLGGQLFLQAQGFVCSGMESIGGYTVLNMEWMP